MKIISWNVNGIRAGYKKGLADFIKSEDPDIFCVQETKAHVEQLTPEQINPLDRISYWSSAERKGYSGTATFLKKDCVEVHHGIGIEEYDCEGRVTVTDHGDFLLYNIYFPNGASKTNRHELKQRFLKDLNSHLQEKLDQGREIIVLGDYNVAHKEIDVHDPEGLSTDSGFLPEEREWFDSFLAMGFSDTFRDKNPDEEHRYTWWDMRRRARLSNQGWRIDYICVSSGLKDKVREAIVMYEQEGSDHCPIIIELEL